MANKRYLLHIEKGTVWDYTVQLSKRRDMMEINEAEALWRLSGKRGPKPSNLSMLDNVPRHLIDMLSGMDQSQIGKMAEIAAMMNSGGAINPQQMVQPPPQPQQDTGQVGAQLNPPPLEPNAPLNPPPVGATDANPAGTSAPNQAAPPAPPPLEPPTEEVEEDDLSAGVSDLANGDLPAEADPTKQLPAFMQKPPSALTKSELVEAAQLRWGVSINPEGLTKSDIYDAYKKIEAQRG